MTATAALLSSNRSASCPCPSSARLSFFSQFLFLFFVQAIAPPAALAHPAHFSLAKPRTLDPKPIAHPVHVSTPHPLAPPPTPPFPTLYPLTALSPCHTTSYPRCLSFSFSVSVSVSLRLSLPLPASTTRSGTWTKMTSPGPLCPTSRASLPRLHRASQDPRSCPLLPKMETLALAARGGAVVRRSGILTWRQRGARG